MLRSKECSNCNRVYRSERDILKLTSNWRVCENDLFWFSCSCGSTLILRENEVSWFHPSKSKSAADGVINFFLNPKRFPRLPSGTLRLQQLLSDEEALASDIAAASKDDPIVAQAILIIANNMRPSDKEIVTLEHAITYIGRNTVKLIALTAAIGQLKYTSEKFSSQAFWRHAFLTGLIAEKLAGRFAPQVSGDQAFIAGALCNIGKLISVIFTPDIVDGIVEQMEKKGGSWEHAERSVTLLSHTKVGGYGAALWGFPKFVVDCIEKHNSLPKFGARPDGLSVEELVGYANQIALHVEQEEGRADRDIFNSYGSICRLSKDQVSDLVDSCRAIFGKARNMASAMSS